MYKCSFCPFTDSLIEVKDHIRKNHKRELEKCLDVDKWNKGQKISYTFKDKVVSKSKV